MPRLVLLLLFVASGAAHAAGCPDGTTCFRLALNIVTPDDHPIVDDAWIAEEVATANRHFAPAGIAFAVGETHPLPASVAEVDTRAQRDRIGHGRLHAGMIDVFIVSRLADVDEPKELRGVHWHERADRRNRFIILSRIAPPVVLAHELGHYFGLPHSTEPASIMNKTPRAEPPPEERTFTAGELEIIRHAPPPAQGKGH